MFSHFPMVPENMCEQTSTTIAGSVTLLEVWRGDHVTYPYISVLLRQQGLVCTPNNSVDAS